MQKIKLNNCGFSLAELIIAAAILIFVLGAFVVVYGSYSKHFNYLQTQIKTSQVAREAVKELQSIALQADQILASHTISGHSYSTGSNTVVLELPSIDGSGNVISGKHDYAVFYVTGKNLYRSVQVDASSSRPSGTNKISDEVASINFTYNNADLTKANKIDADIEMQAISRGQTVSYHLHQAIYLRNL